MLRAEGRIEPSDGTLMCSYHGWRFDGDGRCTDVPQSLDAKANAAACASQRSCATSHPTQVGHVPPMHIDFLYGAHVVLQRLCLLHQFADEPDGFGLYLYAHACLRL